MVGCFSSSVQVSSLNCRAKSGFGLGGIIQGKQSRPTRPPITFHLVNAPGEGPKLLLSLGSEELTLIMACCSLGVRTWQPGELHYGTQEDS